MRRQPKTLQKLACSRVKVSGLSIPGWLRQVHLGTSPGNGLRSTVDKFTSHEVNLCIRYQLAYVDIRVFVYFSYFHAEERWISMHGVVHLFMPA